MEQRVKMLRAASHGDVKVLREMYESYRLDWSDCVHEKTGDSALHIAVRAGLLDVVKLDYLLQCISITFSCFNIYTFF